MGEVGRWDPELFARFAEVAGRPRPLTASEDGLYRALLGEIVRDNDPLVRRLARQLRGPHIDRLGEEEVLATARVAFLRAVQTFDPAKGCGIAGWAALKLRGEIERTERLDLVVKGKARKRAPDVTYMGDEEDIAAPSEDEEQSQMRCQVRPRIFLSERDGRRIEDLEKVSRATIRRYVAGYAVSKGNEARIVRAMKALGIKGPERLTRARPGQAAGTPHHHEPRPAA